MDGEGEAAPGLWEGPTSAKLQRRDGAGWGSIQRTEDKWREMRTKPTRPGWCWGQWARPRKVGLS